jgi:hypothetical protein
MEKDRRTGVNGITILLAITGTGLGFCCGGFLFEMENMGPAFWFTTTVIGTVLGVLTGFALTGNDDDVSAS